MSVSVNQSRCLILGCSRTKNQSVALLPAIHRYEGPPFKVLRRFLKENPNNSGILDIYILSARYGMIEANESIPNYDEAMTHKRAVEMRNGVAEKIQKDLLPRKYGEIFLSMGKTYLQAIADIESPLNHHTQIIVSSGPAGKKLTELRNWLWGSEMLFSRPLDVEIVTPHTTPQAVVLRGHTVTLTTDEALGRLQVGIIHEPDFARQTRNWYVDIAGEKISPKWAAQYLFGVSVSQFSADEARRVLRKLGLNCYQQ